MSRVFFTSDTHYGHAKIIGYANRPFKNVDQMNYEMMVNWNSVVRPEDTVYHIGDFAFCSTDEACAIAKELHGHKHLIFGNHDKRLRKESSFTKLWESTSDYKEIKVPDGGDVRRIILCHYSFKVWNQSHHGSWNLYGHSHGTLPDDPGSLSFDVGVDCWNYTPISYEEVKQKMKTKTFTPIDRHGA